MNRIPSLVLVAALCLLLPPCDLAQELVPTAVVHLKILFPPNADDLGDAEVSLFESRDTGRNYAGEFRHNTASNIPYGIYHLRTRTHGFWSAERNVVVFQPDVWVVIGLQIGMEGGPTAFRLRGSVQPIPSDGSPVWVRLASLYSSTLMDAKVDKSGTFSMAGLPQDRFVLIVWSGTKVLGIRTVETPHEAPLVTDIAQAAAPK